MKGSHFITFICGALLILGLSTISQTRAQFPPAGPNIPMRMDTSPNHVFELRMYYINPGKMDAVQKLFREKVIPIFKRLHMKSIGYWVPQDPPDSQNLLIYILEHPSREAATKHWAAFNADPAWLKARAESEVNGKLVDHIDHYFMNPTDFSTLK